MRDHHWMFARQETSDDFDLRFDARNGLGTAALLVGVAGAVFGLPLITFPIALLLGLVAIVLGIGGRRRAARGRATNRGVATCGVALGCVALLLGLVGVLLAPAAVQRIDHCKSAQTQKQVDCIKQTR